MTVDVLIVGAGFAGAATAYHLSRVFEGSILVVEQEAEPGRRASGRNARLVFQQVEDPGARAMVIDSCAAYLERADALGYRPAGSLLLGPEARLRRLAAAPPQSSWIDAREVGRRVPPLRNHPFEAALWTPTDGVMPIERLLDYYLAEAASRGVRVRTGARAALSPEGGRIGASVAGEPLEAGVVVNAAGANAGSLAAGAGAGDPGLRPLKRHLFVVEGRLPAPTQAPFVWDLELDFYLRPENGGWLVSLCEELAGRDPDELDVEEEVSERLRNFLAATLPADGPWRIVRSWSCFRTHAPQGPVHLGWDTDVENLFWVAGLGGHGMGSSWAVGRQAAEGLMERLG